MMEFNPVLLFPYAAMVIAIGFGCRYLLRRFRNAAAEVRAAILGASIAGGLATYLEGARVLVDQHDTRETVCIHAISSYSIKREWRKELQISESDMLAKIKEACEFND